MTYRRLSFILHSILHKSFLNRTRSNEDEFEDDDILFLSNQIFGMNMENTFEEFGDGMQGQPMKHISEDKPKKKAEEQHHEVAINILRYAIILIFVIETFEATIGKNHINEFNYDRWLLCLALLIFAIYDRLVTHGYKIANTTAAQSSSAIEAMFPEHIRTRFYEYNDHAQRNMNDKSPYGKESLPIADIHQTCTLMFADIVGYTTWSSNHQPEEIMKLLETLYGTFDNIAKKYDVFKVETVGDCYVAATGLPNVQDDHAVVLTVFASECVFEMKKVLQMLGNELSVDTANLSMRFGLHSGPVAAGILRVGNPRFQLFGDTVNTTARLETTGQPGRIHISQSTATFLIESGRADWVIERDESIHIKGKGIMQTYWVDLLQVAPYIPVSRRYTI
eukprot:scaffold114229_cov55-Attheya_sp.AAC.1